ncbi:MAG: aminoacyl-tRNA hydrolase [Elusimicrobia bacterium RIFCSPLOWO2_02_FULL_39_32]|nr:MAG: aminoacyl-tRNA hydrolase [Elusimicrobia bacterium GWA2_38_7]OGR78950.1 MAG: aminoacyl-tRNA hydrolase [Elusimicrobia bacterium RIFCSPHIGHO2_02_FULL_39_36]OGR92534.1 MAG: aminoacyl-tRNA hydrolase [Elusimicrobia bacterium RIFCSPLOWO2_02_FULL_39_32]OGR99182.1 MAG: aminoacyl-tRNA hydrolase [Elusimicrobia bacterium RIFCSPLOWO2_12_FULL_39_28]
MEHPIRFVIGLGNPDPQYEGTPHNLGRTLMEKIQREKNLNWQKEKMYDTTLSNPSFVRLNSYMNASGIAVEHLVKKTKVEPTQLLICFDDFDLTLGTLRVRKKGSGGSHNGLKSIVESLGTKEFPRLRLGIGPLPKGKDPSQFVLSPFSKKDKEIVQKMLEQGILAIETILKQGLEFAMNQYNKNNGNVN